MLFRSRKPRAIILSGGPSSVYEEGAPKVDAALFDLGIPIFGICYGFQAMAQALGGKVDQTGHREYGRTNFIAKTSSKLFSSLPEEFNVWMSHGDSVMQSPQGFTSCGATAQTSIAAFENNDATIAGVQFHPEVLHSEHGQIIDRKSTRLNSSHT